MIKYNIKLSIVVVHLGADQLILNFLESLYRFELPFIFETIIVDNNSDSKNLIEITNLYNNCKILHLNKRLGYSAATNVGIAESKGEYILWCNNDLLFQSYSIFYLVEFLDRNLSYAIASPCLLNEDNSPQQCYSLFNLNIFSLILKLTGFKERNSEKHFDINVAPGACCLIRKEALDCIGGKLDTNYFMYCEEFDLSFNLLTKGYKIKYIGKSKVIHIGGKTTKKTAINYLIQSYKSKLAYLLKNNGIIEFLVFYLFLVLKFSLKSVYFFVISFFWNNYLNTYTLNKNILKVLFKKNIFYSDNLIKYYND
jgi:GT2 family glycosyltransferase